MAIWCTTMDNHFPACFSKHMFVVCEDLHTSGSFYISCPDSLVLHRGCYCLLKSTTLCGYTQLISIDEAMCFIVYMLVVVIYI